MHKIFLVVPPALQNIYRLKHKGNRELNTLETQQKNIFYELEKIEKADFCPL